MARRGLSPLAELASELGDLKRLYDARDGRSLASQLFVRAWSALLAGEDPVVVADVITADAVAATKLGGLDAAMLSRVGLDPDSSRAILCRCIVEVSEPLAVTTIEALLSAVGRRLAQQPAPAFVDALVRQPRAGATCPGKRRIVLEPAEGHGDHCLVVAVLGALLAEQHGSDRATPFLAGLIHHAHNAILPDSGFAGEMLLGEHLAPIMRRLFDEAYAALPEPLQSAARAAMMQTGSAEAAPGRAFNAADVLDRVLQMQHYADVAGFTLNQALDELELVHAGPLQSFHHEVLMEAGLR